jgi:xanthine dehydrogenase molybdenum-binding subunit
MADITQKLIGQNYTTPDLVAKVTGKAKYAEDFRAEGMLFTKLLLSPMPHARVRSIDTSAALAMPGVHAVLREADCPHPGSAMLGEGVVISDEQNITPEMIVSDEPHFQGQPILAVAAESEALAAEAIERIVIDLEPLPFRIDPVEALRPGSPNPRVEGNVWVGNHVEEIKWTDEDFREVDAGRLPFRETPETWEIGDVDAAFEAADLVVDHTVVLSSNSHEPLESRSAMAYWQNGKVYLHSSTQSIVMVHPIMAAFIGVTPDEVVLISEYTGGGFGSKYAGTPPSAIPALLSKKTNRPVMMRISREEEHYMGRGRAGLHVRAKMGLRGDGRITAIDMIVVQDNGPYAKQNDHRMFSECVSANYGPENMRYRGISVMTNTPQRLSRRGPGGVQASIMLDPLVNEAANQLGIDQVEIRKLNAPESGAEYGGVSAGGGRARMTSCHLRESLEIGAERFNWSERIQRNGRRNGSKVTGVGVGVGNFAAGVIGFDGLMTLRPDGRLYIQQGVGNLGTFSVFDTARVAPEVLGMPWERCEVIWGRTDRHLPWTMIQGGSMTTQTMSRANYAGAMDLKTKLQEIAAAELGGAPDDYELAEERVFRSGNPGRGLTFARAASIAIERGGHFDGHELPDGLNPVTRASATALAGRGLMGVASDRYGTTGATRSHGAGFVELEVDVETGQVRILDYLASADVGVVLNPRGLEGQLHGAASQAFQEVRGNKWVFDPQFGVALGKRFYDTKPATILDGPLEMDWVAVGIPDPATPVGAKGVGEMAECIAAAAIRNALANAVGDELLRRTPITVDMLVASLDAGHRVDAGLETHI